MSSEGLLKRKATGGSEAMSSKIGRMDALQSIDVGSKFKICFDVNELVPAVLPSANQTYDNNTPFLITRLRYDSGFLYLFLTGADNVQFYFRAACSIHSYKRCYHQRTPCPMMCKSYKSMVVTGLKERECHRINVYTINREKCKPAEEYLLDDFCTNENRVQMQLEIYEGEYVRFEDGVSVDENGCVVGSLSSLKKLNVEDVTTPIDVIVGCYDLETYTNLVTFSNAKIDPIITISYVLQTQTETKRYCFINTQGEHFELNDPVDCDTVVDGDVFVIPCHNERDMINSFLTLLFKSNPDDILDYNGDQFDIPYLLQRAEVLNIDKKFVQRYNLPPQEMNTVSVHSKHGYTFDNYFMKYFNHLDMLHYVKGSFDASKIENMKLDTVANYYLKVGKVELTVREMMTLYNERKFAKIVTYNVRDSTLPIQMFRKCKVSNKLYADAKLMYMTRDDSTLTIWRKINLALFNRSLNNKSESNVRDEYFFNKHDLTKIMQRKNTSVAAQLRSDDNDLTDCESDDETNDEGETVDFTNLDRSRVPVHQIPSTAIPLCDLKTKMKYTGGKVLSPVPGFYKLIFTLDFSQLYTSIMIHYMCCLSNLFYGADNKLYLQKNENAVTTKFLKEMAGNRAAYKNEMRRHEPGSFTYQIYDSWQNAAKLVCNSQYGWFGLVCKPLANFITLQGRIKLDEAQAFIRSLNDNAEIKQKWNLTKFYVDVVYGDTDSNFVSADILPHEFDRMGGMTAFKQLILQDILTPLNNLWNGAFKMELENIMLGTLIRGKKSYMCVKMDGGLYKRGLNVKKDTPLFLRNAFDEVYLGVLKGHSLDCVLHKLVVTLKKKCDDFCAANCEEYSFSQTLNVTKNGVGNNNITIAYMLYMMLRNDANTKYVPSSGDRIPYLLIDNCEKRVRDCAKPTQLFTDDDIMSWKKHIGIVSTFFNDLMSMLGNDTLFVYAFQEICLYWQKRQRFGVVYPNIKQLTVSRVKDILCKELNIKTKKNLTDEMVKEMLNSKQQKFIHSHEFTLTVRPPTYKIDIRQFDTNCPVCNNNGVSAVNKTKLLKLM
uniref:DNA-directed DNA polymerase n=1 Tax=Erinnyis ello granulovirus TaxID=307444 RepID=A0A288WI23_9BBAC|nr:DNA polymerase [Erinnyis ello granulovirus]ARX71575.1 DNA polymerase [Erinnyis ello granulovirus]ARX71705.1 DNA polymerase [Erinnyis ello granulovirus]ARX71835.1 DNA polymerase [Erinnyis ello granulovirus]